MILGLISQASFCTWYEVTVKDFPTYGYRTVPALSVEGIILSPPRGLGTFVESPLTMNVFLCIVLQAPWCPP